MAESVLFNIAEGVLRKLDSAALQEISLAWGLKSEMQKLEATFSTIKSLLLDAESYSNIPELSVWLGTIKEICHDVEDVVDEFEYEALKFQMMNRGGIKRQVSNFFSHSNPLSYRLKIAQKIKEIRERLDEVAAEKAKFLLMEPDVYSRARHREREREREMTHSFVRSSDVIGRDYDKENIVQLLMCPDVSENVSVIPIVGIGGLGKTTLAKLVYDDERVVQHFELRLWLYVSEVFDLKKLIANIIYLATGSHCDNLSMEQLRSGLRDTLRNKFFLLILDDVWNEDHEKWVELRDLLMEGASGSKIVVTTRSQSVASFMGTIPPYNLKVLSHDDCFSLFLKCAFREGQEKQFPNLVKKGKEIVDRCKGIPLAVRTLGSLLYSKTDERDWLFITDNEIWKLEQKELDILPALRLSYNYMPSYLKQCFSYCAIFPKDYKIDSVKLIQLWMAQGFIQSSNQNNNLELEDIGKQYFNELWSRSFFQVEEDDFFNATCKMHDLIHDLALSVAQIECSTITSHTQNIPEKVKHVSFLDYDLLGEEVPSPLLKLKKMRTIFSPLGGVGPTSDSFVDSCISRFQLLRVLDLSDSGFKVLPSSIGNMKHLRYLDLSWNDRVKGLPDSICKLYNLQTLRILYCVGLKELPRDMGKLTGLRHLELTTKQRSSGGIGVRCFTSLQSLWIAKCDNFISPFEEGMEHFRVLRTLDIRRCERLTSLVGCVKYLIALENLSIWGCPELDLMMEEDDTESLQRLRSLLIGGLPKLVALPQWLQGAANTLQFLCIEDCCNLATLSNWLGNFESLHKLVVRGCPKLTSLPEEGFHGLTALRVLEIDDCGELSRRCERETGEDWPKIAHVPEII